MNDFLTNEASVREEIIAPILAHLHYSSRGPNDVRYEVMLTYPCDFLGRKKKSDSLLVGKADYICRAGGLVAWTVEAKPPAPISNDDVQQAYTYAKHPEVRAVYFCICNGLEFRVYDTNSDPSVPPVLVVTACDNSIKAAEKLALVLGAEALLARHAVVLADTRSGVGADLSSFVQIVGGKIVHRDNTTNVAVLRGLTISVTGGAIQRVEDGSLMAYFEGRAPYLGIQKTIDALGLTRVELYSDSSVLSSDSTVPTIFRANMSASFPRGQQMLDLNTHTYVELPRTLRVEIEFEAAGTLDARVFAGRFQQDCAYKDEDSPERPFIFGFTSRGDFEFYLR
jgi:Type I restriction enzyme R protein N terminus (HSDR_N)